MTRALVLALLLPAVAAAQTNVVRDGGFDDPTFADWWLAPDFPAEILWSYENFEPAMPWGAVYVVEDGDSSPNTASVWQAVPLVPGGTYTFSARYYLPPQITSGSALLTVQWMETYYPDNIPRPLCGGAQLALTYPMLSTVEGVWHLYELPDFVAPGACARVSLGAAFAAVAEDVEVYWDDVRMVPEPAASAVAALAALGALTVRRRPA